MTAERLCNLALTGYVLSFVFLNLVAFLISSFYRKKFEQPTLRAGFLTAMCLCLVLSATLVAGGGATGMLDIMKMLLALSAGIFSAWNSVSLYVTMKRVRK